MLFPNNDQDEFEHKVNTFDVPATRAATSYKPALPVVLEQGATWRGTISAPGALPGGLWVRFVFGPFSSVGEAPKGLPTRRHLVHGSRLPPRGGRGCPA